MAYVLDTSAILTVLLGGKGAPKVVGLVRKAAQQQEPRVLVPFTVMEELELFLRRRVPEQADVVLALVEGWPVEIVEAHPQWRREAVRLQATYNMPATIAWAAALALLTDSHLVHLDPAFEAIPGLARIKVA